MNQGAPLSRSARMRGPDGETAFSHNRIFRPLRQERPEPDRQRGVQVRVRDRAVGAGRERKTRSHPDVFTSA